MNEKILLFKGMYQDRVVLMFYTGICPQHVAIGFSELTDYFDEKTVTYLMKPGFEIIPIKFDFKALKPLVSIPGA